MTEVIANLFLGDFTSALHPDVSRYDTILNVTREVPFSKLLQDHQKRFRFDILDDDTSVSKMEMLSILQASKYIILAALHRKEKVLVHCYEGKQRSVTVVASFLSWHLNINTDAAVHLVTTLHPPSWDHGQRVHFHDALHMHSLQCNQAHLVISYPCQQNSTSSGAPLACFGSLEEAQDYVGNQNHHHAMEIRTVPYSCRPPPAG